MRSHGFGSRADGSTGWLAAAAAGQPGIGRSMVITSWGLVLCSFCVQVGRGFAMLALRVQMNPAAAIGSGSLPFLVGVT